MRSEGAKESWLRRGPLIGQLMMSARKRVNDNWLFSSTIYLHVAQ